MRRIVLATGNAGKAREIKALLDAYPVEFILQTDLAGAPDVEEDAPTLEGNAEKKAKTLATFASLPALADDTGLEVDALDGRPGVYTAEPRWHEQRAFRSPTTSSRSLPSCSSPCRALPRS